MIGGRPAFGCRPKALAMLLSCLATYLPRKDMADDGLQELKRKFLNIRGIAIFCLVTGTIWLGIKFAEDAWTFFERVEGLAAGTNEVAEPEIRPLYFEFDSYELLPESLERLNAYAEVISKGGFGRVRVTGHSSVRAPAYNINLSEQRAKAVVEGLVAMGVDRTRIEFDGVGAEVPLPGHEPQSPYNNRVEIELLRDSS